MVGLLSYIAYLHDPYHRLGEAMGLSFSVLKGVKVPYSLSNIFKELKEDLGCSIHRLTTLVITFSDIYWVFSIFYYIYWVILCISCLLDFWLWCFYNERERRGDERERWGGWATATIGDNNPPMTIPNGDPPRTIHFRWLNRRRLSISTTHA